MNKLFLMLAILLLSGNGVSIAQPTLGKILPTVVLSGESGGKVSGGNWSSSEIKNKVFVLFYVDPDESDLNDHVADAIKKRDFPKDKFGSIAVINMAATWKPNFIIESVLKGKQEKFKNTIYVKDFKKVLVGEWQLADDNYHILVFDKKSNVLFTKFGKFNDKDISSLLGVIEKSL